MTDEKHVSEQSDEVSSDLSRRDFIAMSVAAGIAAAATSASAAAMPVVETDVTIKTPDGMCDAAFIHPTTGSHPGVHHLAGCVRLAPDDARHRQAHCRRRLFGARAEPLLSRGQGTRDPGRASFLLQLPDGHAKDQPLMASINAPGNAEKDAVAFVAFLDAQKEVNKAQEDRHAGLLHGRAAGGEDAAPQCRIALAPAARSTAAAWSPTSPTARTCSLQRSRRGCISESPRMTTCANRTRRTS